MTPARKAALRKAQLASAAKRRRGGRKRVSSKRKRNIKRAVVAGGVAVAVGGSVYAAHKNKAKIQAKKKAVHRAVATKKLAAQKAVRREAENNHAVRVAATKHLMAEARAKKRPANKGMKMGKQYRMGRPDVRKKRKAARNG